LSKKCINVAIVGVNHESDYVGYEGDREFRDELGEQEPAKVTARLRELLKQYDELVILPFRATNQSPYPFKWVDAQRAALDYGAALTRVGDLYQRRFK
jgi:hypothetical protein